MKRPVELANINHPWSGILRLGIWCQYLVGLIEEEERASYRSREEAEEIRDIPVGGEVWMAWEVL